MGIDKRSADVVRTATCPRTSPEPIPCGSHDQSASRKAAFRHVSGRGPVPDDDSLALASNVYRCFAQPWARRPEASPPRPRRGLLGMRRTRCDDAVRHCARRRARAGVSAIHLDRRDGVVARRSHDGNALDLAIPREREALPHGYRVGVPHHQRPHDVGLHRRAPRYQRFRDHEHCRSATFGWFWAVWHATFPLLVIVTTVLDPDLRERANTDRAIGRTLWTAIMLSITLPP